MLKLGHLKLQEKNGKVKKTLITLLLDIRKVCVLWEAKVEQALMDLKDHSLKTIINMRNKLIEIACCTSLTYNLDICDLNLVMQDDNDLITWLESQTKIYKNNTNSNFVSNDFIGNLFRQVKFCGIRIEKEFVKILNLH